jgi:hypothetical protein
MAHTFHFTPEVRWLGWLALVGLLGTSMGAQAQDAIYRCGSTYTNNPTPAEKKDCKLIEGGNVTVISAPKPRIPAAGGGTRVAAAPAASIGAADQPKVDPAQQRARDSDAKAILEAELKRAEARVVDLQREYNNGNPERRGDETRNHGKYVERVADLKASVLRAEADVVGIRRELQRLGVQTAPAASVSAAAGASSAATGVASSSPPVLGMPVPAATR